MVWPPLHSDTSPQLISLPLQCFLLFLFFSFQTQCVNPTHVRTVAHVSGLVMTLTANALQGTVEVSAMLVNTTLPSCCCLILQHVQARLQWVRCLSSPRWLLCWWWRVLSWNCFRDKQWRRMPPLELSFYHRKWSQSIQVLPGQRWARPSQLLQVLKKKNAQVSTNSSETQKRRSANEFYVIQKSRWRTHALVLR